MLIRWIVQCTLVCMHCIYPFPSRSHLSCLSVWISVAFFRTHSIRYTTWNLFEKAYHENYYRRVLSLYSTSFAWTSHIHMHRFHFSSKCKIPLCSESERAYTQCIDIKNSSHRKSNVNAANVSIVIQVKSHLNWAFCTQPIRFKQKQQQL